LSTLEIGLKSRNKTQAKAFDTMIALDRVQKVGLAFFIAAWAVLITGATLSLWQSTEGIFLSLLLLSFIAFASDLFSRKTGLRTRGKIVTVVVIVGLLLLFYAPAVQSLPSGQSTGTECNPHGCSEVYQFKSLTDFLWCWGAIYQYSPPPVSDSWFGIDTGCPPPPGP
jgi:hypothetical protein